MIYEYHNSHLFLYLESLDQHRCPRKQIDNAPEEVWKMRKQSTKHLRVFGSLYYRHVHEARRKKYDDRSESMILIGIMKKILIDYKIQLITQSL